MVKFKFSLIGESPLERFEILQNQLDPTNVWKRHKKR